MTTDLTNHDNRAVLNVIKARTSYRGAYKQIAVDRKTLQSIMDAGLDAPSGCNRQTTSLIAVDDPALLKRLYELFPVMRSIAPAVICVLAQQIPGKDNKFYHVQDYSAAIENMLLAIVSLGYQSCWYEGQLAGPDAIGKKMANLLGVPDTHELVAFLPVGIAEEPLTKVHKKSYAERAWFNGFAVQN